MTVITIVNCSAKGGTSHLGSSGLLPSARKSQPTTVTDIVRLIAVPVPLTPRDYSRSASFFTSSPPVGKKNKDCLCETCEKNGKGGYAPERQQLPQQPQHGEDGHADAGAGDSSSDSDSNSNSDSDSDSDSSSSSSDSENDQAKKPLLNINERRTRRGVYAVTRPAANNSDDSDDEDEEDEVEATVVGSGDRKSVV